jgi:hypothetical protein
LAFSLGSGMAAASLEGIAFSIAQGFAAGKWSFPSGSM